MFKNITKETISAFKYDISSPSCLSWNIEIRCGIKNRIVKTVVGQHCTDLHPTQGRYYVEYKNSRYSVSRIIYFMFNDVRQDNLIDHLDGNTSNNKIENLRLVSPAQNSRNMRKRKTSELNGVTFTIKNGYEYWRVTWTELGGVNQEIHIPCKKYGKDVAKQIAIAFRKDVILRLNEAGAGYTDRHVYNIPMLKTENILFTEKDIEQIMKSKEIQIADNHRKDKSID